jgi:hypothetical protein
MRDRVFLKGEIMVRFATVAAVLALMAAPLVAQESTEQLRQELEQLRKEVDGLKADRAQYESKEVAGSAKVDAGSMAPEGDSPIMTALKGTKLSGFVDAGYQVSFGNGLNGKVASPAPGLMSTRVFDERANSFYLNAVQLNIERLATKDMIVGYHFELAAGHDVGIYNNNGSEVGLQEGWLQILAPVGSGIDIRVGKQAYLGGFEVIESKDDFNYSRGLLFGFIQPFTQTGIRASYSFGDQLSATIGFSNSNNSTVGGGADQYADNDNQKNVDLQLAFKPTKDALVQMTITEGTDKANFGQTTAGKFYIFDIVASYTMDKLIVGLNLDWASANRIVNAVPPPNTVRFPLSGLALYGKYAWTDAMASALRWEYFSDGKGAFYGQQSGAGAPVGTDSGTGARVWELTLTQEMKVANQLILRVEVRTDNGNNHIMSRDGKTSQGDTTLGFEAIMPF